MPLNLHFHNYSSFPSSRPFSHASYPTESVSHIHSNLHTHPSIIMHTKPIPMAIFLCSLTPHLAQTNPLSSSFFIPTVTIPTCSTLCTFHHSPCMRGSCTTSRHHSLRLCTHPHQQPMAAAPFGRRQTAATAPLFTAPPRLPSSSRRRSSSLFTAPPRLLLFIMPPVVEDSL